MIGYCSRSSVERTSNIPHKLRYFLLNQQKLLLVDAVGAAVTAFANFFLLAAELIKTGSSAESVGSALDDESWTTDFFRHNRAKRMCFGYIQFDVQKRNLGKN